MVRGKGGRLEAQKRGGVGGIGGRHAKDARRASIDPCRFEMPVETKLAY